MDMDLFKMSGGGYIYLADSVLYFCLSNFICIVASRVSLGYTVYLPVISYLSIYYHFILGSYPLFKQTPVEPYKGIILWCTT
jgi:hypothetical protein